MSGFFDYDIKCCTKYFKWRKDMESKKWELDVHRDLVKREDATKKDRTYYQKCIEKEEKELAAIEEKISEYESRSSDAFAQKYIDELPVTRKRINLSDELNKFKLSKVPDLSRFENLETLNLSCNEYMASGFDRLPVSLRKLDCYKTKNNPDASWVTRLVNLEELTLRRNDEVGELPDLSGLTKLKVLNISQMERLRKLPNLPLNIKVLILPNKPHIIDQYLTRSTAMNSRTDPNRFSVSFEGKSAILLIERINHINRFNQIRTELIETTAKMLMNPERLLKMIENEEIALEYDADWEDVYTFQERPRYAYY